MFGLEKLDQQTLVKLCLGLIIALAVVLILMFVNSIVGMFSSGRKERFGGTTIVYGQELFPQSSEGYMGVRGNKGAEGMVPRFISNEYQTDSPASVVNSQAAAIRADLAGSSIGAIDLRKCHVSPVATADPWLYLYQVAKTDPNVDPAAVVNAPVQSVANPIGAAATNATAAATGAAPNPSGITSEHLMSREAVTDPVFAQAMQGY
jgi:hypothetical protein